MLRPETAIVLYELRDPREPTRLVRVRVEGPRGHASGPALPHVICMHGFKGFMHWGFFPELSRRIARAGMVAVSLNASGCGVGEDLETFTELEAFERDTATRQQEDLERVRGFVEAELPAVDPARLGLFGHSRGGAAVLLHASRRRDYRALVTWSAVDRLDAYDQETRALWRAQGGLEVVHARTGQVLRMGLDALEDLERNAEALDVGAACGRIQAPTLVVHGDADEVVDQGAAQRLLGALPEGVGRLLTIPGTGHTLGAGHPLTAVGEELERALAATVEHFTAALHPA